MIRTRRVWQAGVVAGGTETGVWVRFEPLSHCQRCLQGEGCGAGVFSRLFAGRQAQLHVETATRLGTGQPVRVGIPPAALLRLAVVIYGLPVLVFILAAASTATLLPSGWVQDLVALISGMAAASIAVSLALRSRAELLNPQLEVLSASAGCAALESGSD